MKINMSNKIFITAKDVSSIMDVSIGHVYKIIRLTNYELKKYAFLIVAGNVLVSFLRKKLYVTSNL